MRSVRNRKGFTLIELMIVVVIIGILAALAIPRFTQSARSSRNAEAGPVLKQLCTLAQAYYERWNAYPSSADAIPQWQSPNSTLFNYSYTPNTAAAAVQATGQVDPQSMNCQTLQLSGI